MLRVVEETDREAGDGRQERDVVCQAVVQIEGDRVAGDEALWVESQSQTLSVLNILFLEVYELWK